MRVNMNGAARIIAHSNRKSYIAIPNTSTAISEVAYPNADTSDGLGPDTIGRASSVCFNCRGCSGCYIDGSLSSCPRQSCIAFRSRRCLACCNTSGGSCIRRVGSVGRQRRVRGIWRRCLPQRITQLGCRVRRVGREWCVAWVRHYGRPGNGPTHRVDLRKKNRCHADNDQQPETAQASPCCVLQSCFSPGPSLGRDPGQLTVDDSLSFLG